MLELVLEGDLAAQLAAKFSAFESGAAFEDVLDEMQALMLQRIRQRFLEQTAPDGSKWPVSQAAIERNFNGGTLFDTGTLFHSLQAALPTELERTIATDVPYGIFHQIGTKTLPRREFLGYSEDDVSLLSRLCITRVLEAVL